MGVWVREKLRNTLYSAVQAGQRERERKRAFVTLCIVQCRQVRERLDQRISGTMVFAVFLTAKSLVNLTFVVSLVLRKNPSSVSTLESNTSGLTMFNY